MRHAMSLVWLLLVLSFGCKEKLSSATLNPGDYSAQIKALESADLAKEVSAAVASGDLRFVGVRGDGPAVPNGPEWVRYGQADSFVRYIPNTSDVILSEQHARLQQVAYQYAQRYNELLLKKMPSLDTSRPAKPDR